MIYLAYTPQIELNGQTISINGHRSRIEAISQQLEEFTMMSLGDTDTKPNYEYGDMVIIDAGNQQYEHLLDADVYSVLISDDLGIRYENTGVDLIVYVSGGAHDFSFSADVVSDMFYVVDSDVQKDSWIGGNNVVFIPGSNRNEFWEKCLPFSWWCDENGFDKIYGTNLIHSDLMKIARESRCVITASGVTAKEMVYQGVPCVLILTANDQLANYSYFIYNKLALPQDVDPEIIGDTIALSMVNQHTKLVQKLDTKDLIQKIEEHYNEVHR
jgi:hypothetical protein